MPVPTYDELLEPTVHALQDLGGQATNTEIEQRVIERLSLSEDVVREPHGTTGQTSLAYRLAWARTYLKTSGYLQRVSTGVWQLTPEGLQATTVDPAQVKQMVRN
ncbi:hypothetical protein GCM10008955_32680 [Deinococcus malanensis]|uniref:Restriction system protein Mrr-like N-terminal domain-containing protein n=1 Tax=Deinococcus malanensis TaxID=1706855 RepID=A0ABQ2F0N3_9DEIO|nr:winged helix-turn-helix domain-containing protein [Deinococcus malanensis]GGK36268.1 hypothetical protein GCM10008955_32680 [Deinococcus malanensis]